MKIIILNGLFHTVEKEISHSISTKHWSKDSSTVCTTTKSKNILKPIIYTEIRKSLLWLDNLLIKDMNAKHIKNALAMVCKCKGEYKETSNAIWIILLQYELDYRLYTRAIKLLKKVYKKGTKITIQL